METQQAERMEDTESVENVQKDMPKISVADYSEKSFIVFGELTRTYKDSLKKMGGKFNKNLKIDGKATPGWIYSKKNQEKVMEFVLGVHTGQIAPNDELPSVNGTGMPSVEKSDVPKYQFVKFKIFRPTEGMKVQLKSEGNSMEGVVTRIKSSNNNDIIDTAYVDFNGKEQWGVICRGKWQLFGYFPDHTLFFN